MADMAQNPPHDKNKLSKPKVATSALPPWQRRFGPTSLSTLMPKLVKPAFKTHSAALASLLSEWPHIIGEAYGRRSEPKKISAGTLTIGCDSITAIELSYLSASLIERINLFSGRNLVQRLRFVHMECKTRSPALRVVTKPAPVTINNLPEGALKNALASLGGYIQQRAKKTL